MVTVSPKCVAWSFLAQITFGIVNFLISYTNVPGVDPWAVIGWIWLTSGLIGLLVGIYFWWNIGAMFFTDEQLKAAETYRQLDDQLLPQELPPNRLTLGAKILTIIGGMCVGWSQLMMKWAFATDPKSTGPLTAVISSDIIVVGVFCHFVYKERLSAMQVLAICIVLSGLVVMAAFDGGSSGKFMGFIYAILGMLTFAASLLCIRQSCRDGMAAWSGFIGRMGVMFFMGLIALLYTVFTHSFFPEDWSLWAQMYIWPQVAGISQAIGVLALNYALMYPSTGPVNVIVASNSIIVLALNFFLLGLIPTTSKLVGMVIVICGVSLIILWQPKKAKEEEETYQSRRDEFIKRSYMRSASMGGGSLKARMSTVFPGEKSPLPPTARSGVAGAFAVV
ncbi:conserved hypothetical protein [Perkinsus marinus ATCC 50983]|uniref:EamA domain-containing protein n=1 Tax=Perkinsus marinus (strain ATCC 50983 / TXsc) TaxID=423536 RepID=C5KHE5_PERM5|nr:conserved hypothetical protein [Perkinsus marinus ATCC 50983]EER16007.1 conserved hypothetical protein [Perkinsus marinus ATCC 50983]|eukprot:XP_002784211.1 conserved hypothetical protein [Perkinsus marinus ATCC 50983]